MQTSKKHKQKKDKRFQNTRVLLHAMGSGLREHIEQSITNSEELEALNIMTLIPFHDPNVEIDSFIKSKTRTELLLVNAEQLFNAWARSSRGGAHRMRREIIRDWYFRKKELSRIASDMNRSEDIILTQLGIALDQLSVYFFGEDGLQRMISSEKADCNG